MTSAKPKSDSARLDWREGSARAPGEHQAKREELVLAPHVALRGPSSVSTPVRARSPWFKRGIGLVLFLLATVGFFFVLRASQRRGELPDGLVAVNGRLEGDTIRISAKQSGRVQALLAREGDTISAGQVLARLDDEALRARESQARAALAVAERRALAARANLAVMRRQVPLAIDAARAAVVAARADIDKADAALAQAEREDERARRLLEDQAIDRQQAERSLLARRASQSDRTSATALHQRAARGFEEALLGPERLAASEAEARVLDAAVEQARAQLAEVHAALDDTVLTSPVAGTVTNRFGNLGEIVTAGAPLFELVDLDALYLRAYVPEPVIGRVPLGAEARIYTDAEPEHPARGVLRYIASRAEFTPKEVQTPDERTRLVYAVKIYLQENPGHALVPGLSVDAVIRWQKGAPWARPRW